MEEYLKIFTNHAAYETYMSSDNVDLPNVSFCRTENEVHYNSEYSYYHKKYLTFECITAGTVTIVTTDASAAKTIYYSTNNGTTWTSLTTSTTSQSLGTFAIGDTIMVKGNNEVYSVNSTYNKFGGTAQTKVYGNIMSLIYGDNFVGEKNFPTNTSSNFSCLFDSYSNLKDASRLILPSKTVTDNCYYNMFHNCTSLTKAPKLPATTLGNTCYTFMFQGCSSLTSAPELPATTLSVACYAGMFSICSSLTSAPELPATTLESSCYHNMFSGCSSLTSAPELPAATLVSNCYTSMFAGCVSLNYIKAMFTTEPGASYTQNWVQDVPATGTFVKNENATWNVTGNNGIPSGWTVQTASA